MFKVTALFSLEKPPLIWRSYAMVSLLTLLAFLAWDSTGWDMNLAHVWGDSTGFALRDNWWLSQVMHQGMRSTGWLVFLALLIGIWRPWGPLQTLATPERAGVFIAVVCALLSVTLIKGWSQTSCPWDLQMFGGMAPYVSHWDLGQRDGGGGHCFPAGHASTGFAFMAAYFGLRQSDSPRALVWLGLALVVGFVLGFAQQVRGAHFMSHTFWTAWLCWTVGWISHVLFHLLRQKKNQAPAS